MATAETGHHANRMYVDQDGNIHLNGSSLYLDESGTAFSGSEAAFTDGVTAGQAIASKAVVLGTDIAAQGVHEKVVLAQATGSVAATQSGTTFVCAVDAVITLPAVSSSNKGCRFIFVCGAVSSGTGLSISPNAADNIYGQGLTANDDKDLINSGATDRLGDLAEIVSDGTNWLITRLVGTWAKQP